MPENYDPKEGDAPPDGKMLEGYNQTYLIQMSPEDMGRGSGADGKGGDSDEDEDDVHERRVLFRCGNWCYTGHVMVDKRKVLLDDIPRVIPMLQRQQNRLHFFCNAKSVPRESDFRAPLDCIGEAQEFAARELSSESVQAELGKWTKTMTWMEDEPGKTYFELQAEVPAMEGINLIASKTYSRGLVFIIIYFESTFYVVVQDGEGDQPLLDVKFPDVSHHGQGIHLAAYRDNTAPWRKLTLWHSLATEAIKPEPAAPARTVNLTTTAYLQMYTVMKPRPERGESAVSSAYRDVLFRFGSWCYSGTVQLTPSLALGDIPHVIPALRMQQSRLEFLCDVAAMPSRSPYAKPMEAMMRLMPYMEAEIHKAEDVLGKLVERLSAMGLGDSITQWLEGEAGQSFFEFQLSQDREMEKQFKNIELLASKCYHPSGVVLVTIFFAGTFYVVLADATGEQPLLDSRFPDVSTKGRGYQVTAYSEGAPNWPQLRKVSVWQTAAAMQTEMEARLSKMEGVASGESASSTPAEMEARLKAEAEDELSKAADSKDSDTAAVASPAAESGSKTDAAATPATAEAKPEDKEAKVAGGEAGDSKDGDADADAQAKPLGKQALSPLGGAKVRAPHHLRPMEGLGDSLSKIRANLGNQIDAPWDAMGRPRVLGGASSSALGSPGFKK